MNAYYDRKSALQALLDLTPPLEMALDALRVLPPLPGGASVVLTRTSVQAALEGFTSGVITAPLLERWAEALHAAEDVELSKVDRDFVADALFELSSPELFGSAEEVVASLQSRDRGADGG
nr:hypothetical protein [Propionicimonas sp.]